MAQFINSFEKSGVTPGERRFGSRLRDFLENDYLCWYDVPVGPLRQHPDFVVLHPARGLLIFEVKDWKLDTLRSLTKQEVEILTPEGAIKTLPNPLDQARGYCMNVVNRLSTDPQLQDPQARYRGKICFPYGYGVVFTNITRRQINDVMSEEDQEQVLPPRLVIYKDEMTEGTNPLAFQEQLWGMFYYAFGHRLTLPQIERIRWHLFPEIRITGFQRDFFAREEPRTDTRVEETIPEIVRVMDLSQEQLARSMGDGHRIIHGVAGSGKTLILGYRCLHLAQYLAKPILVLCFNVTLAARLRSFVEERGIADRVRVHHFHDWCASQLETYHVEIKNSPKPYWEQQVESVIAGVECGLIPRAQYGAVLIDEGHDFEPEWLKLVAQMTDPERDSLLLLYDDAQSIYRKKSGLSFTLSSVGIKAQGRTTVLRLNYRNTREILGFAYDFAANFLEPKSADDDHIPLIRPEAAGCSGPHPAFRRQPSLEAELTYATHCVQKWHQEGLPLQEIAIIYFYSDHGRQMAQKLKKAGIPHLLTSGKKSKEAYDPRSPQLTIISAASSKGLEFATVIVIGVGHLKTQEEEKTLNAKFLYVSMTRAKEKLLLTASSENLFTQRLAAMAA